MSTAGLKKPEAINTSLPSVRLLQSYIRHKQPVEVKVITGEAFSGLLSWIDGNGICLKVDDRPFLIWYAALSYVKPIGELQG